ncbi:MAG: hypothetical protein OCD76_10810 [Reichenbachiella sp.]
MRSTILVFFASGAIATFVFKFAGYSSYIHKPIPWRELPKHLPLFWGGAMILAIVFHFVKANSGRNIFKSNMFLCMKCGMSYNSDPNINCECGGTFESEHKIECIDPDSIEIPDIK